MIDPLNHLVTGIREGAGAVLPGAADPVASQGLMIIGVAIILATALWATGALVAAVWTRVSDLRDRRLHFGPFRQRRASPR